MTLAIRSAALHDCGERCTFYLLLEEVGLQMHKLIVMPMSHGLIHPGVFVDVLEELAIINYSECTFTGSMYVKKQRFFELRNRGSLVSVCML